MKQSPAVPLTLKFNNKWTIRPLNWELLKLRNTIGLSNLVQEATRQLSLFAQIYQDNLLIISPAFFTRCSYFNMNGR